MEKEYVVVRNAQYYTGDIQHPSGWSLRIMSISEEYDEIDCRGTLEECNEYKAVLDSEVKYIDNNMASYSYDIAEVDNSYGDPVEYQDWLDSVDWEGCPSEDGNDYEANCQWAEENAYDNNLSLPVADKDQQITVVILTPTN